MVPPPCHESCVGYVPGMTVEYEVRGRVALLTINRPEARNAVNGAVANGMEEAIDQLEADEEVWLGVLTGNGPVFCAGADLKAISAGQAGDLQVGPGGHGRGRVGRRRQRDRRPRLRRLPLGGQPPPGTFDP